MRLFSRTAKRSELIRQVQKERQALARLNDEEVKARSRRSRTLVEVIAAAVVVSSRVLGLNMFDEQIQAAVALSEGHVVEMATGEGKTLAAVPAVAWYARAGDGVHVLTANDYLAG
jgi:preprotein translocase subunit SecA